ncbi:MAG: UvrB/UvrC motif-containing protein [Puniceicoccales bacterium]|nr:UvrB/UvrC motif-containing protein [Puniceicoccales bacterium]
MVPTVCDCCGAPATVHVMQVADGDAVRFHLCTACAQKKGFVDETGLPLCPPTASSPPPLAMELPPIVCPRCGWRMDQLLETRRLGCGRCYEVFRRAVDPLLQRLQGSLCHRGRRVRPFRSESEAAAAEPAGEVASPGEGEVPEKVRELQNFLQLAIAVEDYERAAAIRDRLAAVRRRRKSPQAANLPQRSHR